MKRLTDIALGMKIWLRLVIVIWLMIALAWSGMLLWTFRLQRQIAMEQAQDFAVSVHQMTLAGLTGMMITGTVGDRAIFLEQIRQSNSIRSLRVVRGAAVMRQYGTGTVLEPPADAQERLVLGTGQPLYELRQDERGNILRAVLPVVAQINYLGKDCLGCHDVRDGATLGAISMEISLQKMDAAMKDFAARTSIAAIFICLSLLLVLYLSLSRSVTRPLRAMTRGLDRIATGEIEPDQRLPVRGADEIAEASAAFNRVMEKVAHMLADERIAVDVFNHALEGIMVADRDARILKVNPAFTRTTGYSAEEAIGQTPKILQSGQQDAAFYQAFWRALTTVGEWQGDIWNRRKNGEIYPEWLNISCARNDAGEVEYYIAIFSDITERKRQEALITYQGYHDALTGLPNRTLFKDRLEQALAVARRQGEQAVAVMFLDLDRFKFVNDSLGHDVGDLLLKEVARRLRASVREEDTVARMGGDEFTVLLPNIAEPASAEAVAAKILAASKQPYHLADKELHVTTSIGISMYPRDGNDAETLMKNADSAMYNVKGSGRAAYCMYSAELSARTQRHMELESDLYKALHQGDLSVLYQPQWHIDSGRISAVEAMVHWIHPGLGAVPTTELMNLAEETGLSNDIGEWLLQSVCRKGMEWRREGYPSLRFCVGLTQRQFQDPKLVQVIETVLAQSGLPAAQLELEISESLAMQDVERSIGILDALRLLGVGLAIAEFGVAFHSSIDDLRRMPVNTIKIDRSFVRDLHADASNSRLVEGIIDLSRGPQIKVVATGVESREQLETLRALRCDSAQGRLLSTAMPAEELVLQLSRTETA